MEVHVGHAEAHRGISHVRVFGHVDEVATRRELARTREAEPVHLRDHRLGQVPDAHPPFGDMTRPCTVTTGRVVRHLEPFVATTQVVAGRERRARAADDRDRHIRVLIVCAQRFEDRTPQRVDQAVALLGPVHRDSAHPRSRLVDQDHFAFSRAFSHPLPGLLRHRARRTLAGRRR